MKMTAAVRAHFERDLASARTAVRAGDVEAAWAHLEQAHVLSQPWVTPHLRTHARMLALALRTRDLREVAGQLARLVVAAPGSASSRYPVGNSGRSRVSMFAPMPVAADVAELLEAR